jgi:hypothetical protein
MATPRNLLVDPSVTRYYHCISRCVRQAMLCGAGKEHRKAWIEKRLETLSSCFAIGVCGFSVLDNHLHNLLMLNPEEALRWSSMEVIRRWVTVFPPRDKKRMEILVTPEWIKEVAQDAALVEKYRGRLASLSWFMKALKEPLARMANKEDNCKGAFWDGRFKSIAILDVASLMATNVYIDLNLVAAGLALTPEASLHTSIRQRILHAQSQGVFGQLKKIHEGFSAASDALGNFEEIHWLVPLEDRRGRGGTREGMFQGANLASYLLLADYTGRLHREGKASIPKGAAAILDRIENNPEFWQDRMQAMFFRERLIGSFHSSSRKRLSEAAVRLGFKKLANLNGCRTMT